MPLAGVIRVTSTDTFCHAVLPEIVARLTKQADDLSFELLCSNAHLDLSRMHADVTVRPTFKLPDDLYGEVAAQLGVGFYSADDVPPDHWLGLSGVIARAHFAQRFMEAMEPKGIKLVAAADSFLTLRAMAEAGLGRVVLPCVLGDASPKLHRIAPPLEISPIPVFVASHADLADAPRLRLARRRVAAALAAQSDRLLGIIPTEASNSA
ncbi:LysR substrate-binding domain-containing protein [Celeribacter sp.]|uniref:LysR substrate-binding domain-containing protein n=1 Tax=Celeribacter sp. TaxID=1890673 RepID=UPI003A911089